MISHHCSVRQRTMEKSLGHCPSLQEIAGIMSILKNGKAPGNSNILSEMLKVGC